MLITSESFKRVEGPLSMWLAVKLKTKSRWKLLQLANVCHVHEVRAIQKRFVVSLQILLYARIIEITCSLSFQRKKGRKTESMMFRGTICFFRFSDLGKKNGTTDRCLLCQWNRHISFLVFFRPFVNSDFFGGKTQYDYFKLLIKGTKLIWLVVIW